MLQGPLSSGTNRANSWFTGSANANLRMCTSFPRSGERFGIVSTRIMSASVTLLVAIASSLALISLEGRLYQFLAIDPFWPRRPAIIQPNRGEISRRQFWIPAHTAFELALIAALVMAWSLPAVRFWLLVALISHAAIASGLFSTLFRRLLRLSARIPGRSLRAPRAAGRVGACGGYRWTW